MTLSPGQLSALIVGFLAHQFAISATAQAQSPRGLNGVRVAKNIPYVADGHERQVLDLYTPVNVAASPPRPLIVWIHGGGWRAGSKDGCPPLRHGFVDKGYAIASINYRLSGHAKFPAQIEDCKAAIRWLRAHAGEYGIDSQRLGVWGNSAGGHLVALVGTTGNQKVFDVGAHLDQSSTVQAVVNFYGPTDFNVFVRTPGYESHGGPESPEAQLIGGPVVDHPDIVRALNPISYVDADDPPFLIVHGDADPIVPLNQSELLDEALRKHQVPVQLHVIPRGKHGGREFSSPEILAKIEHFFANLLQPRP